MRFLLVISLLLTSMRCTNDNVAVRADLDGKWVDMNTKTDTLTFTVLEGKKSMILGRGKELRSGSLLPKYGSGFYEYNLLARDTISLHWFLSSNVNPRHYYFKQTGTKLTIEKFFETTSPGVLLTFKKID